MTVSSDGHDRTRRTSRAGQARTVGAHAPVRRRTSVISRPSSGTRDAEPYGMKTTLLASMLLVASGALAAADPAPRGPDFVAAHPPSAVGHGLAASDGTAPIEPLDVIAFAHGSAALLSSGVAQVDTAARWLHEHPNLRLVIEGHTDKTGSADYNENLATRRAETVRRMLMQKGIASDRLVLITYGENDTADRRVVMYASDRPVQEIVTASLDHGNAIAAVWTRNGTLYQEQSTQGREPREIIATRP